jgi:hypothetical protein
MNQTDVIKTILDEQPIVSHPNHYTSHPSGIECLEISRYLPFGLGNCIKYLWRSGIKGGQEKRLEDVSKALFYLDDALAEWQGIRVNATFMMNMARFLRAMASPSINKREEDLLLIRAIMAMYQDMECDTVDLNRELKSMRTDLAELVEKMKKLEVVGGGVVDVYELD